MPSKNSPKVYKERLHFGSLAELYNVFLKIFQLTFFLLFLKILRFKRLECLLSTYILSRVAVLYIYEYKTGELWCLTAVFPPLNIMCVAMACAQEHNFSVGIKF